MSVTATEQLPGGTTLDELQAALRASLGRPDLVLDSARCSSVVHTITAPATASLTRVRLTAQDAEPFELSLIAKCLQTALRGLPPQIPQQEREQIAATIPWRLEAEVYTGDTASRMPPGVRLPRLHAAMERADERIVLWLEDADPLETPWGSGDLERAAMALGRLTVRRADQVLTSLPPGSFLSSLVEGGLKVWALPHVCGDELWAQPAFAQPEVAAVRPDLVALAAEVDALFAGLSEVPWRNTHGDPTPMNMLRPRSDPDSFVLIDWGTASLGPVGWDVVPLVFGPAENGTAAPSDLAGRMSVAIPAFEAGLAEEGWQFPEGAVGRAVRRSALLRYPFTSLPLGEFQSGTLTDESMGYARRKAGFIAAVLEACRPAGQW